MKAKEDLIRPEHRGQDPRSPAFSDDAAAMLRAFAVIEQAEHGRPGRRRELRMEQVAALVAHARDHSAFWRARLPAGARALDGLPVLTRAELRAQAAAEGPLPLPPSHGVATPNTTSGATSEPLSFFVSDLAAMGNAARYAYDDVAGGRRLDLPFAVAAAKIAAFGTRDRWPTRTGEIWRTGPGALLPLTAGTMEDSLAWLLDGPGGHVSTRPAVVEALILRARQRSGRLPPFGDFLTFGELVSPALREEARSVLGGRITDRYSAEEVGPIAFECRRKAAHYHVATSMVALEVVDERRRPVADGKAGDVLLTGLVNLASPVIRYDIGDRAALLPRCPCGHDGPTLRSLVGRRRSLVRLPDGRMFFLRPSASMISAVAPVEQWRALQTEPAALVLEVTAPRPLTEAEMDGLAGVVHRVSSPEFAVTVRQVPEIDWGPSGKRQLVVNLVDGAGG